MLNAQAVHVTPKEVLATELRAAWEVVGLLILVEVPYVVAGDVAGPLKVKVDVVALDHVKTGIFARVHHSVVDVSRVSNFERHKQVLDLISVVLAHTVSGPLQMTVARIWEEGCRWSVCENRLEEVDVLGVWLKHTVGQTRFFALDEHWVDRVFFYEPVDFLENALLQVFWQLAVTPERPLEAIE